MNQTHSKRRARTAYAVLAAGTAVALLAGCSGGGSTQSNTPTTPVEPANTFTLIGPMMAADGSSALDQIAKQYEQETGVSIKVEGVAPDGYDQALRTRLQAGSAPDLMSLTPGGTFPTSILTLAKAELLAPIAEASAKQSVSPGMDYLVSVDGTYYGQPTGLTVYGVIYNDATASNAGVSYPKTIDDMLQQCRRLGGNPSMMALAGAVPSSASVLAQTLSATLVYAKDPKWNQKRQSGEVTFAGSAEWREVLETFKQMVDAGCFQAGAAGAGFDALFGGILKGSSLSISMPSLAVGELTRINPAAPITVNAPPTVAKGKSFVIAGPGAAFGINAKADPSHQAAAQQFLDWMAKPENAKKYASLEGSVAVAALGDTEALPATLQPVAPLLAAGDFVNFPSNDWSGPEVNNALGVGLQGLLTGQSNIDAILTAMDQAWKK